MTTSSEFSHVYEVEYRSNTPVILRNNQELTLEQIPIMERLEVIRMLINEVTKIAAYAGSLYEGIMALAFDKEPSAP